MAAPHQYTYVLAVGFVAAFADAWNIGANDVSNVFATSVASRSLTTKQAMILGSIMEFAGAVGAGGRVADTIRSKVLDIHAFSNNPYTLMLGNANALIASSLSLSFFTWLGLSASTTHTITGGILGCGFATVGFHGIDWSFKSGVAQMFVLWGIAPLASAVFGAPIFLLVKHGIMERAKPVRWALVFLPFFYGLTGAMLTMLIIWKGAQAATAAVRHWSAGQLLLVILGVATGCGLLSAVILLPYLYQLLIKEDWRLRWHHYFQGLFLLRRGRFPHKPEALELVQNYYQGHKTKEELGRHRASPNDLETNTGNTAFGIFQKPETETLERIEGRDLASNGESRLERGLKGKWYERRNIIALLNRAFFHGVNMDVANEQKNNPSFLCRNLEKKHAEAKIFDNKTEHAFSYLQVLTAATESFANGANDISNAVAPLTAIYLIWSTGQVQEKSAVPIWTICYTATAMVIGLWTYGYSMMRNLGNRVCLHSPCRGFSMELGNIMTVVVAARLDIPISTTQGIVGSTVGVALCDGWVKSVNWRLVIWMYCGWIVVVPVTTLVSYCLTASMLYAPNWVK